MSEKENFDSSDASRLVNRLRRVEGQARGLQRMIEEGRPCEEVFTQLAATKAALDRVGMLLISLKMRECLAEEAGAQVATPEAVDRALDAFLKYARCVK
jgi:DNA-binding FrmR family transcriptional regulator